MVDSATIRIAEIVTFGAPGVAASLGHFDQADYERQLEHGAGP